jgi:hypothetical protein
LSAVRVEPNWAGEPCFVAATGPSLTPDVIKKVQMTRWFDRWRVIAVNDAYKVMPWADAMFACDNHWWEENKTCGGFAGEKWASHEHDNDPSMSAGNDKRAIADKYGINIVRGENGAEFSFDPTLIRYGWNSGFQAVNLALLKGCRQIVLVGFDMRFVDGKSHFFGDHKVRQSPESAYQNFAGKFAIAAKKLPPDVLIINATPGSAMTCFPMMSLEDACREAVRRRDDSLYRDRAEPHAAAG